MTFDLAKAQKQLSLHLKNPDLLQQALSHRSVGPVNNERLEFLGDSILGCVIADWLYRQFPDTDEGILSRLRSSLVNQKSLAKLAKQLQLGDLLLLGPGEMKSGGFRRHSILSDALEALIGALYLDQGFQASQAWIERLFSEKLAQISPEQVLKDPKTRLQECLQATGDPLPEYVLLNTTGQAHEQTFYIECKLKNFEHTVQAQGSSRREAEQIAANMILELMDRDSK